MTGSTEQVVPCLSVVRWEWCRTCQKATVAVATITAVTSQGVSVIGGCAVCADCGWTPYAQPEAGCDG